MNLLEKNGKKTSTGAWEKVRGGGAGAGDIQNQGGRRLTTLGRSRGGEAGEGRRSSAREWEGPPGLEMKGRGGTAALVGMEAWLAAA